MFLICSNSYLHVLNLSVENRTMETIQSVINKIESTLDVELKVLEDDKAVTINYNDQCLILGKYYPPDVMYDKICTFVQIQLLSIHNDTLIRTVRSLPYGVIPNLAETLNKLIMIRFSLERVRLAELDKRINSLAP